MRDNYGCWIYGVFKPAIVKISVEGSGVALGMTYSKAVGRL